MNKTQEKYVAWLETQNEDLEKWIARLRRTLGNLRKTGCEPMKTKEELEKDLHDYLKGE